MEALLMSGEDAQKALLVGPKDFAQYAAPYLPRLMLHGKAIRYPAAYVRACRQFIRDKGLSIKHTKGAALLVFAMSQEGRELLEEAQLELTRRLNAKDKFKTYEIAAIFGVYPSVIQSLYRAKHIVGELASDQRELDYSVARHDVLFFDGQQFHQGIYKWVVRFGD